MTDEKGWSEKDWWTARRATIAGAAIGVVIVLLFRGFPLSAGAWGTVIVDAALIGGLGAFIGRTVFKHYSGRSRLGSRVSGLSRVPSWVLSRDSGVVGDALIATKGVVVSQVMVR